MDLTRVGDDTAILVRPRRRADDIGTIGYLDALTITTISWPKGV